MSTNKKKAPARLLKTKWEQLTPREKLITLSYAKGLRGMKCARDAGFTFRNDSAAISSINRVLAHPAARKYVKSIVEEAVATAEQATILTIQEKLQFCARVVRCKIHSEPDDSDLWQELIIENTETAEKIKRKLPDKRLTIETDNKLQGHGQPDPEDKSTTDVLSEIIRDIAGAKQEREKM